MRLVVHCGFHKTASTHFQHLLDLNRAALSARGVFYQHAPDFAAHHRAAWQLLAGDAGLLDAMLEEGARQGCDTVVLSSEDLEGAIFNPRVARLIAASAARAGAEVEWHIVLREPGATFASLFAQLQWHVYVDALWMFAEIMNKGGLYMHDPAPNWGGTPYWFYCFDHARHLGAFADAIGRAPFVHDYAAAGPYPGWRLVERLGGCDALSTRPGERGLNRRHADDSVRAGLRARVAEAGGEALATLVDAAASNSLAAVPECARLVGERFGGSYSEAVARYGAW